MAAPKGKMKLASAANKVLLAAKLAEGTPLMKRRSTVKDVYRLENLPQGRSSQEGDAWKPEELKVTSVAMTRAIYQEARKVMHKVQEADDKTAGSRSTMDRFKTVLNAVGAASSKVVQRQAIADIFNKMKQEVQREEEHKRQIQELLEEVRNGQVDAETVKSRLLSLTNNLWPGDCEEKQRLSAAYEEANRDAARLQEILAGAKAANRRANSALLKKMDSMDQNAKNFDLSAWKMPNLEAKPRRGSLSRRGSTHTFERAISRESRRNSKSSLAIEVPAELPGASPRSGSRWLHPPTPAYASPTFSSALSTHASGWHAGSSAEILEVHSSINNLMTQVMAACRFREKLRKAQVSLEVKKQIEEAAKLEGAADNLTEELTKVFDGENDKHMDGFYSLDDKNMEALKDLFIHAALGGASSDPHYSWGLPGRRSGQQIQESGRPWNWMEGDEEVYSSAMPLSVTGAQVAAPRLKPVPPRSPRAPGPTPAQETPRQHWQEDRGLEDEALSESDEDDSSDADDEVLGAPTGASKPSRLQIRKANWWRRRAAALQRDRGSLEGIRAARARRLNVAEAPWTPVRPVVEIPPSPRTPPPAQARPFGRHFSNQLEELGGDADEIRAQAESQVLSARSSMLASHSAATPRQLDGHLHDPLWRMRLVTVDDTPLPALFRSPSQKKVRRQLVQSSMSPARGPQGRPAPVDSAWATPTGAASIRALWVEPT